jgi:hypothetical protein
MKDSWTNSLNLSFILERGIVVKRVEKSNVLILLYCWSILPVLSSFMTYPRFVTRVTRRVPLVEQELLNLSGNLSSPPVFSGIRVVRSLVFCEVFCISLFVLLSFFF